MARVQVLMVLPIVLVIGFSTFVFFERHWHEVQTVLVRSLVREIAFLLNNIERDPEYNIQRSAQQLDITVVFQKDAVLPELRKISTRTTDQMVAASIKEWLRRDFDIDSTQEGKRIALWVAMPEGVYHFVFHRKRLESFTIRLMLAFMLFSGLLFSLFAAFVMRNQIKPIVQLTQLMKKNQHILPHDQMSIQQQEYRLGGAAEIRALTREFYRLQRKNASNLAERAEMLCGISHDLRTPLTRMNLQLQMLEPSQDIDYLKADIDLMTRMINSYLQFIEHNNREQPEVIAIIDIIHALRNRWAVRIAEETAGSRLFLPDTASLEETFSALSIFIRPELAGRCLDNLIDNGLRFADHVWLDVVEESQKVLLRIADDGPGIPTDQFARMLEPFQRLDENRMAQAGGSGLGLAMVKEATLIHHGEITLDQASEGGLLVTLAFPAVSSE